MKMLIFILSIIFIIAFVIFILLKINKFKSTCGQCNNSTDNDINISIWCNRKSRNVDKFAEMKCFEKGI